ncbi:MAG: tRNA (adenosine(37)-N6)-threonylcarbamoyltransferase complex dimerization subunit type 1 TsaB [Oscillospiraceae bacterium]|nr:tRNA (adenosine(37)-N6)-threonylcarbamoyltransferase complex dimerization subunit type 1 TsaB [Oscillospiraceae bacterium]
MKLLALESSAVAASCCICVDGQLLAQSFQNNGLTHSRTLLPMVTAMLENCGLTLAEMDGIAVAAGPGSFTGLRIGVSAAKGLAWAENKPVYGVSTLEAMAWNPGLESGLICCAMDARRKQVYNALFQAECGVPVRLTEDRAIAVAELLQDERLIRQPVTLVGDGARLCWQAGQENGLAWRLAPEHLLHQSAWGVAKAALKKIEAGETGSAADLVPNYLRLSQAERERLEKGPANRLPGDRQR